MGTERSFDVRVAITEENDGPRFLRKGAERSEEVVELDKALLRYTGPKLKLAIVQALRSALGSNMPQVALDALNIVEHHARGAPCPAPHANITHPENMSEFAPHGTIFREYTLLDLPKTCGVCGAPVSYAKELLQRLRAGPSVRDMQDRMRWGAHSYSRAFQEYKVPHRDFAHALLHVQKAVGKLAIAVDDADHSEHVEGAFNPDSVDRFIADLVILAVRLANTCPGRRIDLEQAIEDRLSEKFNEVAR
jgi:hypothetical protein